ncbi:MAG: hypothetical protein IPL46_20490 [Saprospiraceae bacterium]|nr:hypothetical protein [Saprospiraceae bacterium]
MLGNIYFKLKLTKEALFLFEDLLNGNVVSSSQDLVDVHGSLYEGYKAMGNIPSAFKHLEMYHELTDSLLNHSITEQINDLEIKYQTEKKEKNWNWPTLIAR